MKFKLVCFIPVLCAILLLSSGSWNSVQAQATTAGPNLEAIDAFVGTQVLNLNLPGLALGIVHGDQIVHLQSFGVADPSGRAITPQTPFVLASLSKSFTALAIMQLVDAGQAELDAPVQQYLPWFRVADESASARITVRHLLNQTSGLSTWTGNRFMATQDLSDPDAEGYVRSLSSAELAYPVGEGWQYSNANYVTLGLIVQVVSGEPYPQYIQNHILTPLDMHNSFLSEGEAQQHGLATGYQPRFGRFTPVELPLPDAYLASGGIIASAEDMTHYLIPYLNEGRYKDTTLISPAGIAELWQAPPYLPVDQAPVYAMGWYLGSDFQAYVRHHWGNGGIFTTYMAVAPEEGWGVIVLVNADHAALVSPAVVNVIGPGVISMLLDEPLPANLDIVRMLYLGTFLIVALQLMSLVWAAFRLRRWLRDPVRRPQGAGQVALRIVLPIALNLLVAYVFIVGFPSVFGAPLGAWLLHVPDWVYGWVASTVLALGWLIWGVSTVIVLRRSAVSSPSITTNLKSELVG